MQARRTGTASVLGELFDHGCDAITTVFVVTSITISLQACDAVLSIIMSYNVIHRWTGS